MVAGEKQAVDKVRPPLDVVGRKTWLPGLKDPRLAAAAEKSGKHLPMLDAVRARMAEAVEAGMGDKDWSGVADHTLRH